MLVSVLMMCHLFAGSSSYKRLQLTPVIPARPIGDINPTSRWLNWIPYHISLHEFCRARVVSICFWGSGLCVKETRMSLRSGDSALIRCIILIHLYSNDIKDRADDQSPWYWTPMAFREIRDDKVVIGSWRRARSKLRRPVSQMVTSCKSRLMSLACW